MLKKIIVLLGLFVIRLQILGQQINDNSKSSNENTVTQARLQVGDKLLRTSNILNRW